MTSCVLAQELDQATLLAYLHGEAEDGVSQHLERCAHCRDRARELARLHDHLTANLYRLDCPSPSKLGEYHLDMLSQGEAGAVAQHLAGCAQCAQELAQLEGYLHDLAPDLEPGLLEQVKGRARVLIAGLVRRATPGQAPAQPALAPAYAGIRGGEPEPQLYEVAEFNVSIESQPDASHPGCWTIVGLVMGFDGEQEAEAQLWQAGARLASSAVSDTGGFCLDNLAPGAYDLVLCAGPCEVHIRDMDVGGGASGRDPTHSDRTTDGPD